MGHPADHWLLQTQQQAAAHKGGPVFGNDAWPRGAGATATAVSDIPIRGNRFTICVLGVSEFVDNRGEERDPQRHDGFREEAPRNGHQELSD